MLYTITSEPTNQANENSRLVILLSAYGVSPSLPTSTTHPYLVKSSHLGLVRHEK